MYTANSPAFVNSLFSPTAATVGEVAVSLPLGISINNAFGRPWIANAPFGSAGYGTVSVTDPNGAPFKGSPSPAAGGVFAADLTNRSAASTHGLTAGALAAALITKSPDGSGRAVFVAALADGSVVQVHVQKGVDGLAAPGTFTALPGITAATALSAEPEDISRVGMAFNWVPNRALFVTDPMANRILVLDLGDDGTLLTATPRYLRSPWLDRPIDIAPTSVESAARNFASNTTLGAGSDLYVLNRGNNTIVRMTQTGTVVAARRVQASLPGFRVAGLGVSPDGQTIWVTATAPGGDGAVLRLSAFGGGPVTTALFEDARAAGVTGAEAQGAFIFSHQFGLEEALGPLFNGRSCVTCHSSPATGGSGVAASTFVTRVARVEPGADQPMAVQSGPVARTHSIRELGGHCGIPTGAPAQANLLSQRMAMTLRGTSLIDNILDAAILAGQAAQPPEVRGRTNVTADGRLGKFGWKAATPTLVEFMADAFRDEMGLTSPLRPRDLIDSCGAHQGGPELDGVPLTALVAFLDTIDPPAPTAACLGSSGAALFAAIGCASCHTPSLPGPGTPTAAQKPVRLYSDLLLHDLGPAMADGIEQEGASGVEFRTAPLWGARDRQRFLHDGRATTLEAAITAHGGQATTARDAFSALYPDERQALLDFLGCI
jgi:DNA-binding beta-propeller fold protein YncE